MSDCRKNIHHRFSKISIFWSSLLSTTRDYAGDFMEANGKYLFPYLLANQKNISRNHTFRRGGPRLLSKTAVWMSLALNTHLRTTLCPPPSSESPGLSNRGLKFSHLHWLNRPHRLNGLGREDDGLGGRGCRGHGRDPPSPSYPSRWHRHQAHWGEALLLRSCSSGLGSLLLLLQEWIAGLWGRSRCCLRYGVLGHGRDRGPSCIAWKKPSSWIIKNQAGVTAK